jgi:hypothetical protein
MNSNKSSSIKKDLRLGRWLTRVVKIIMVSLWIAVFSVLILVFMSCEPEADLYRTFVTPKGEHYSTPRVVQTLQSNVLAFNARFNTSAKYHFDDDGYQDSKNKLMGFADCNSLHHENSARFAWQWFNNQLEIWAYCYVNGNRVEKFIGVANVYETGNFEIHLRDNEYVFYFNNYEPVSIPRWNVCTKGAYYMLWPYFGGTMPAPHNVSIDVKINF